MKTSDAVAMTVEPNNLESLKINYDVASWEERSKDECAYCIVPLDAVYVIRSLIAEVEFLREKKNEIIARVEAMLSNDDDKNPMAGSFDSVVYAVLEILRGE